MAEGLRFNGKVTIVTGGSSGIGKGCAAVFVRNGSKVVICGNNEKEGKEAEAELNKDGPGEVKFIFADVTKEENIKTLIDKTVETYGKIDCLINNAGWHPPYNTIDGYTADEFKSLFDLNVLGYFLVAKYALPHLRKTQGSIINNASMEGHFSSCWSSIYSTTKGAVQSFTKSLAVDEAKYNVRVNSISPGAILTPLADVFINSTTSPEKARQAMANISVLGRTGTPEECGMTCLYLAADATFCTGIDIQISGGAALNYGCKNVRSEEFWPKTLDPSLNL